MGYWKQRLIEQEEQGWDFLDKGLFVCADCFNDEAIREFIEDNPENKECSYCENSSEEPIAVSMNQVLEIIGDAVIHYFNHPAAELPRDDGKWVFGEFIMDIDEVLEKLGCPTEEENVAEDIRRAFGGRSYVKRQFFSLTDHEQLSYGWKDFVNEVKHQRRYLFMLPGKDESENISEEIPSHKMLHELGHVVDGVDLIKEMKAGTQWFRVRIDDPEKRFSTASELGTVPKDKACCSNRMSPAGIPMFYGAADEVTAIAETYIAKAGRKAVATVGTFETARDFVILDLTQLPPVPSAYDRRSRHLRPGIAFIEEFVETLIQPITKNGREHIDYVPTQIVTEYFRCVHKTSSGDPINGILYRSSKDARGKCCVLFFENDKCCEATDGWEADARNCLGLREVLRKEM